MNNLSWCICLYRLSSADVSTVTVVASWSLYKHWPAGQLAVSECLWRVRLKYVNSQLIKINFAWTMANLWSANGLFSSTYQPQRLAQKILEPLLDIRVSPTYWCIDKSAELHFVCGDSFLHAHFSLLERPYHQPIMPPQLNILHAMYWSELGSHIIHRKRDIFTSSRSWEIVIIHMYSLFASMI